jgi:hypothetical protein
MRFVKKNGWFRETIEGPTPSAWPRIGMPTWRNFTRSPYRCGFYEAQDVLVEIDDVDLICLERDLTLGSADQVALAKNSPASRPLKDIDTRELRAQGGKTS